MSLVIIAGFGFHLAGILKTQALPCAADCYCHWIQSNSSLLVQPDEKYQLLVHGSILQSVSVATVSLTAGFLSGGAAGLILGWVVGPLVYGLFLRRTELVGVMSCSKLIGRGRRTNKKCRCGLPGYADVFRPWGLLSACLGVP
jgi:hypothetical protein